MKKTKQVGLKHNLGFSKVNLPHFPQQSCQTGKPLEKPIVSTPTLSAKPKPTTSSHDLNIAVLTIIMAGAGWYFFR